MEFENFRTLLNLYRRSQLNVRSLHDVGVDLIDSKHALSPIIYEMLQEALKCFYTQEGIEWVDWYIFESDWGEKDFRKTPAYIINAEGKMQKVDKDKESYYGAHDADGNPICYTLHTLHDHIQKYHLKN